jgi:hypothetical protein
MLNVDGETGKYIRERVLQRKTQDNCEHARGRKDS